MPASKRLKLPTHSPVARRVARYVNHHFGGNLSTAADALGCKYHGLRSMALGSSIRADLDVLAALAKHSGQPIERWMER